MASKVLVKIPAVNFNQVGKHGADLVSSPAMCPVSAPTQGNISTYSAIDPTLQINQLEQNVRFLKEQHQLMLSALHQEIEVLRNRNRDLQFQLVFSRGEANRSFRSPEEATVQKVFCNQQQQTPLPSYEVENLEGEIAELRASLSEARTNNMKLQEIIDEQQRRMADLSVKPERNHPSERERSLANQLQETVQLVHRMRRFHEEQRRELVILRNQKFQAQMQQAADVREHVKADQGRVVKHPQCGQPSQTQHIHPTQPRSLAASKSIHQHHHQTNRKIHQQQQQQMRHEQQKQRIEQRHDQYYFPREIPPEDGSQNNRFPPLPAVQNYWQNNGHSKWTSGMENGQRPSASRPVQSMPSLPAINSSADTPSSGRRSHNFRGGCSYPDNPDGSRKFRGRGSGGRSVHRNHDE